MIKRKPTLMLILVASVWFSKATGEIQCPGYWHTRHGSITKYAKCIEPLGLNKQSAEQFCGQLRSGSELVRLSDSDDSRWIREELLVREPYHFSLVCSDSKQCYSESQNPKQTCIGMDGTGKKFEYSCGDFLERTYVCERRVDRGYIDNVTSKFYVLYTSNTTCSWINASQYCLKQGYEIVQLRTSQEQANLMQHVMKLKNLKSKMFPLGLKKSPNNWHWTNGKTLDDSTLWTNWTKDSLRDETPSENEGCAMVDGNEGDWLGTTCSNGSFQLVICQTSSSVAITQNGERSWCYFEYDTDNIKVKETCFYSRQVASVKPNDCSQMWDGSIPVEISMLRPAELEIFLLKLRTFCDKTGCDESYNIALFSANGYNDYDDYVNSDTASTKETCYFTDNEGSWNSADCDMPVRLPTVVCQYNDQSSIESVSAEIARKTIFVVKMIAFCIGIPISLVAISGFVWTKRRKIRGVISNSTTRFDAFVSYSALDRFWVHDVLMKTLEDKYGFRLCIHYRDFPVGGNIIDTTLRFMSESRVIIVVMTQEFISRDWCMFELREADRIGRMGLNSASLVIIKLGCIDVDGNTPPIVSHMLDTYTYIEWSKDPFHKKLFWSKLVHQLNKSRELWCGRCCSLLRSFAVSIFGRFNRSLFRSTTSDQVENYSALPDRDPDDHELLA